MAKLSKLIMILAASSVLGGVAFAQDDTAAQTDDATNMETQVDDAAADTMATEVEEADLGQVVATANGVEITLGEVLALKEQLPAQYLQGDPQQVLDGILNQIAVQNVIQKQAADSPELELRKQAAIRTTVVNNAIQDYVDANLTDEELQKQYDTLIGDAPDTEEWNASHILVDSEDAAKSVIERINGGEDFAAVAMELSSDGSAASGGELGWFGAGQMVPEFQTAVEGLEVGALSAPVESQFGWHVIKLNDKRVAEKPAMDDVRDQLSQFVEQDLINSYISDLEAGLTVETAEGIDPSIINGNLQ